ncbi:MAG: NAD(P)H-binding protein [Sphingomonas sp.]|jgi:short subunit dehydrogenase-like uncharacterized protein|uniref:saccharopine dehydrogenase family protein n=1 Tax=Sphingomonas sp. TaxID=28214 RepID=UPI0035686A3E
MDGMESRKGHRVAVFGAAGHTGRFVIAELLRRGLTPIAVGRDAAGLAALEGVERRVASIEDPASLDRAFAGAAAVINGAGPFLETAEAVAAAAIRAGIPYLDVTAEQASASALFDRFDADARRAGVILIPAMGFYGGLADLLVTSAMGEWDSADAIEIGIALDSWHPTRGTRITGARNTAPRLAIEQGALVPIALPAATRAWDFPPPFARQTVVELPFSEVILISRHLRTGTLHTHLNETALNDIRDPATPAPVAVDASGRSAQRFLVEAVVTRGADRRRIAAQGQDIYAFSAPLICEAVERLLDGRFQGVGVQAPGAAFDAPDFLGALGCAIASDSENNFRQ